MSESTDKPTVADRVGNMPQWLQQWYSETKAIIAPMMPWGNAHDKTAQTELAEQIAFRLAAREYKARERNKESYGNALALIMEATDAFEINVGSEGKKFKVSVHPADGQGVFSLTIEPGLCDGEK